MIAATFVSAVALITAASSEAIELNKIGSFDSPVYLDQPDGKRQPLFVVSQDGVIFARAKGSSEWRRFLDVSDKIVAGGEQGLLGLAFAPNYQKSRQFYINYTNESGDTRIVAYKRSKNSKTKANPRSARILLRIDQPYSNHNGGQLITDNSGRLLVFTGDGGAGGDPENRAQNKESLLGKILRIKPKPGARGRPYRIPGSNPYVGSSGRDEIFALGLRNPWRDSLQDGWLQIGDVGQGEHEEVNFIRYSEAAGANFGWSRFEGDEIYNPSISAPGARSPQFTYPHSGGRCSITGGYTAGPGSGLGSDQGRYFYADFCDGKIHSLRRDAGSNAQIAASERSEGLTVSALSSFGQDSSGRIYALSLSGDVYRLEPSPAPSRLQVREQEFSLTLSRASVPSGDVIIQTVNSGEDDHDLVGELVAPSGEAPAGSVSDFEIPTQHSGDVTDTHLDLAPGEWRLWCDIPGHREAGMESTLQVG